MDILGLQGITGMAISDCWDFPEEIMSSCHHLGVTEDDPQPLEAAATEVVLSVPEVLVPGLDNHRAADHLQTDNKILHADSCVSVSI